METARTKQWPQYLAAITATISLAITGSHIGWTSPTLPYLKGDNSHVPITSDEASWVASFYLLGTVPGNIIAAFLVDRYGRKRSLLGSGVPLFLGWLLILVADNRHVLYASRFISGLGQGLVYVVCPMYIGEIADSDIRGALGSFMKLMVTLGELYAHAIGPFVSYEILAGLCAILPLLFVLSFAWMPESPYFFLMHERRAEAEASLMRLRVYASRSDLDRDIEEINEAMIRDLSSRGGARQLIDAPGNRRAVIASFGLQLVLQFSGLAAIESYTQEIFAESESGLSAGLAVIILGVFQLAAGVAAAILVDRMGRRPLLIATTTAAGIALAASCSFYFLKLGIGADVRGTGWVLDASVMMYELAVALGLSPLSYMMLGELFPTNVKGVAVTLANVWAALLAFFVSKMYQVLSDNFGVYVSFAWFSVSCFIGIVFIAFFVPETKGKSLNQIQDQLNGRKVIEKSAIAA
ncbi:facilitated trehalose transporter Tret1 [Neodiprion pinetum]|uniref:Facilitated trehalose transporter Tret1 n=1 Tax=Neodiprion lecontei TaxID=441921 RepID=A0A6J0CAD4_NEOLC|nr:facilitated trehalose transporter Tret1 [Neodiprion lecontei]XP_046426102.1 facilitated trehalose transporter Tret1-like [Neodiprion fabricii]XP_046481032.1 facilitated trehalose transporter Tret1-like [Neodiprion pinetum]XP_046618911.1 facilitated trehalose transporter Tret1-like [Neodiprion virginianus]